MGKLCDTCVYRDNTEYFKPCIIYRDDCELYEKEKESMTKDDLISRQAVLDIDFHKLIFTTAKPAEMIRQKIKQLPPVNPQEPKTGHCKECKYFEYDSVAKVDGVPLIVAHEICSRWGDGCKTREDGYCFMYVPKAESEE